MLNLSRVALSKMFSQSFKVIRQTGFWSENTGEFVTNNRTIPFFGSIQPMDTQDIDRTPHGDQIAGKIEIYSTQKLYTTREGQESGLSDIVLWNNEQWRVLPNVQNFSDYGYWYATATKVKATS